MSTESIVALAGLGIAVCIALGTTVFTARQSAKQRAHERELSELQDVLSLFDDAAATLHRVRLFALAAMQACASEAAWRVERDTGSARDGLWEGMEQLRAIERRFAMRPHPALPVVAAEIKQCRSALARFVAQFRRSEPPAQMSISLDEPWESIATAPENFSTTALQFLGDHRKAAK